MNWKKINTTLSEQFQNPTNKIVGGKCDAPNTRILVPGFVQAPKKSGEVRLILWAQTKSKNVTIVD